MSKSKDGTKSLSKGILEMKFMQATRAKVTEKLEEEDGRALYNDEIHNGMNNSRCNIVQDLAYFQCEEYIDCRLSFRGMNPEIERLMALAEQKRLGIVHFDQPMEVDDSEMVDFYESNRLLDEQKMMQPNQKRKIEAFKQKQHLARKHNQNTKSHKHNKKK